MKVKFVCFATEGPPHDTGLSLAHCLKPLCDAVKASGVDEIFAFTPKDLPMILNYNEDKVRYCMRQTRAAATTQLINYHNVGMGAWKPEIIKFVVDRSDDEDIVMYYDSDLIKNPDFLTDFAPVARKYAIAASSVAHRSGIFSLPHLTLIHTLTKGIMENIIDKNYFSGDVNDFPFLYDPAARGRCIIVKVNKKTREFVDQFVQVCSNPDNLSGSDSERDQPWGGWSKPGYIHSAGEQAALNALLYGRGYWNPEKDKWIRELRNLGFTHPGPAQKELFDWEEKNCIKSF